MFYQRKRVVKEELTRALSQLFFQSRSGFNFFVHVLWDLTEEPQ